MSVNINRVVLTGNLTRDPEQRQTQSGSSVCGLRLAVNSRRKDQSGQWIDKPNYFDVTVFGALADNCATYLAKGRAVAIDGRLDWSEWQDKDGAKRQSVGIIAESVQFLSSPQQQGQGQAPVQAPAAQQAQEPAAQQAPAAQQVQQPVPQPVAAPAQAPQPAAAPQAPVAQQQVQQPVPQQAPVAQPAQQPAGPDDDIPF